MIKGNRKWCAKFTSYRKGPIHFYRDPIGLIASFMSLDGRVDSSKDCWKCKFTSIRPKSLWRLIWKKSWSKWKGDLLISFSKQKTNFWKVIEMPINIVDLTIVMEETDWLNSNNKTTALSLDSNILILSELFEIKTYNRHLASVHSCTLSSTFKGANMRVLLVYTICPFMIISSNM